MAKCVPCLSSRIKQLIKDGFNDPAVNNLLSQVPECDNGREIDLCVTGKGKRTRSEYQTFVSTCMKSKHIKGFGEAPKAMKECASEWKNRK